MWATLTVPECGQGHGPMRLVADAKNAPVLCEPVVSDGSNRGFAFVVFRCPECSYMEFLDAALPLDRRQYAIPTRHARRTIDQPKPPRGYPTR